MKPLTLGAGQLWVHMFLWKKWMLMIYEINHIWTAEMKWKWRNDRRSEHNLRNCVKKPEKNSGLQPGLNPWPRDTSAMLYQLSYEATDVGSRSIVDFISTVHIWFISYIISSKDHVMNFKEITQEYLSNCKVFSIRRSFPGGHLLLETINLQCTGLLVMRSSEVIVDLSCLPV